MAGLPGKIKRYIKRNAVAFRTDCQFSWKFAFFRLMDTVCSILHINRLSNFFYNKKENWILHYLESEMKPVLEKYRDCTNSTMPKKNAPIWACWWSGEDTAPLLVQQCLRSTRAHAGSHPVHLITEENYADYIAIPDYILKLVSEKKMGLAHLADYIRICLLEKYGGLWLDATIFCSQELPEYYFSIPVFTCKSEYTPGRYISGYRWSSFCLGGHSGQVFFKYLKDAFERYWSRHEYAIDYLFFDYLIYLAYMNVPAIRNDLDAVPINNPHRDDLQAAMNAALPAEKFASVIQSETVLYKLSWREVYSSTTVDGMKSIFSHFLSLNVDY